MALINCPECTKNISDKAKTCVHCGYPLRAESGLTFEEELELLKLEDELNNDDFYDEPISEEEYLCCNKCYSEKLTPMKKGFSVGKAAVGALTLGAFGILAGSLGSNNVRLYCNNCGNKLKSSEAISLTKSSQKYFKENML